MPLNPNDYVTPMARYEQAAQDMSGSRRSPTGMAPYPLYGTDLGQVETPVVFYKRPIFCLTVGVGVGVGLSYLWFGVLKPKFGKHTKKNPVPPKKNKDAEET